MVPADPDGAGPGPAIRPPVDGGRPVPRRRRHGQSSLLPEEVDEVLLVDEDVDFDDEEESDDEPPEPAVPASVDEESVLDPESPLPDESGRDAA